jgi:hypothetical protein
MDFQGDFNVRGKTGKVTVLKKPLSKMYFTFGQKIG